MMLKMLAACVSVFLFGSALAGPSFRPVDNAHALSGVIKAKPTAKPDMFAFKMDEESAKEKRDNELNQAYAKMQRKPADPTAHLSEQVRVGIRQMKDKHGNRMYMDQSHSQLGIGTH
jgi:hypothetical protein